MNAVDKLVAQQWDREVAEHAVNRMTSSGLLVIDPDELFAELGGHAKDCDALPDPDADGPGAWDETFRERAAGRAYRHAQDIVRRIAGVTA